MDMNFGEQPVLTGPEVFEQLKMLNPHVNEDDFKDNTGNEWDMDKLYEELQVYHDYGLEEPNYRDVAIMEWLNSMEDGRCDYEAFKAKVSELMPGYGDEEYRELW